MRTTRGRRLALSSSVLAIASVCGALTGCAAEEPHSALYAPLQLEPEPLAPESALAAAGPFTHYIALGDSYSAGTGLPDQAGDCTSSKNGWPFQVAKEINKSAAAPPPVTLMACSGARTENITGPYPKRKQTMAQTSALSPSLPSTTLVTITVGGNDSGAIDFGACLEAVSKTPTTAEATCTDVAAAITKRIDTEVASKLLTTFNAIRSAAPTGATIVAVGYPHVLSTENNELCKQFDLPRLVPTSVRTLFNSGIDRLNTAIATAAKSAGILSITSEIVTAFEGRGICSEQEYIVALSDPLVFTEAAGHPNAAGYGAYTSAVLQALSTLVTHRTVSDSPEPPVAGSSAPPPVPVPGANTSTSGVHPQPPRTLFCR